MSTIHYDIRIQGTPGKALMAIVRDMDTEREIVVPTVEVAARTLDDIFELCQSAVEARIEAKKGRHLTSP